MTDTISAIDPKTDTPTVLTKDEMKKKYIKGGVIGGLLGIPAPIIGPIIGGGLGLLYMHRKYKKV